MQKDNFIKHPVDGRPMTAPPFTILGTISGIIIILLLVYFVNSKRKISKDRLTTPAKITAITPNKNDLYKIAYEFYMDEKKYTGTKTYKINNKHIADSLSKKSLPVIFISNNPEDNELLVTISDFKKYSKHFPDSLKKITGLILNL